MSEAVEMVFRGGGEVGALCRAKDWSATPLGPVERWPQSLKTAVSLALASGFPMFVFWGPELVQIYNDECRLILGARHPEGLGQSVRQCWPESWHISEDIFQRVLQGETLTFKDALYPLASHGRPREYFLTLSYSPIRDESGAVGGVLVTVFDVTQEVRARAERDRAMIEAQTERERLYEVFMQAPACIAVLVGPDHTFIVANARYTALIGGRDVVGKTLREALPEVVDQRFPALLDMVRSTGTPFVAQEAQVWLDRRGDGSLEEVYVDFVYQPLKDASGQSFGIMVHAIETTEQVRARRSIEALAAERSAMLNHIADAVVTFDPEGRVTFVNDTARALYPGIRVGTTLAEQQGQVTVERLDGTPYPLEEVPSARAQRGERVISEEWTERTPGAPPRQMQGSAVPVHGEGGRLLGAVLTARDVTVQQRLQRQLQLERSRLNDVFMQAPAAIMVTRGPAHVIEAANPRYMAMVGDRPLIGKTLPEAFPDLAGQGLFELYDQVLATREPYVGNEALVRVQRFGRLDEAYFNFVYQPLIGADGQAFGTMTHAIEVTDVVRARQQAEQRTAELVRLTQALEQSNRDLDQFAYVASHDLKAPLRGIANLAQWIQEDVGDGLSDESQDHMRLLLGRVHRMEALIEGILAYSRAGRVREVAVPVDTGALIKEALELLTPPEHVRIEVQPGMPTVTAERVPLQQVFMNLLSNAIKFTAPSRPDPLVRVGFRASGSSYELFVADNGPGISPEYHERIWGIFQTLEARDKIEGTGIGLSVVKKIVETRGGRTWLESTPGSGATFFFTWPK